MSSWIITRQIWNTMRKTGDVRKEEGVTTKGLKNLTYTEKTYIVIIVLGLIGIIIKYVIL